MTVLRDGGKDMCQRAMDVLLSVVQHDAGPLRDYFTEHTDRDDFKLLLKCGRQLPCRPVKCLTLAAAVACHMCCVCGLSLGRLSAGGKERKFWPGGVQQHLEWFGT